MTKNFLPVRILAATTLVLILNACSVFNRDGMEMLKKATVEIRDIKVTGISFGTEIITSDGKVFDVSKPNLEMLRYVKDLNSKNFDIKVKKINLEGILAITNPHPLGFELEDVTANFSLDTERVLRLTEKFGIEIPKNSTKENPIKGEIPLDINFLRLMQAENINIDGQAGLLIKILGKGFTYEYEFKESYKIPKEEIQKKIDATIEEYLKKITGYFNNAGDTNADSLPEDISGLLKLLN